MSEYKIKLAETDAEVELCCSVMLQLRPHLTPETFRESVKLQTREGYQLAYVEDGGAATAVAGLRVMEMLAYGRILYVDDLVTDEAGRSRGYGGALIDWLVGFAKAHECVELQLDSGVHRGRAHAFYFQKRMHISAYHFALKL